MEGLGVKKSLDNAFLCLKDAVSRGNVYAMGHLVAYYYHCKLYVTAAELAARYELSFGIFVLSILQSTTGKYKQQ